MLRLRQGWRPVAIGSALVAGACTADDPGMNRDTSERDPIEIQELRQRDQRASLAGDREALFALWSEDPVALPPDGPIRRGREALRESLDRYAEAASDWETLEYEQEFAEVRIVGDYAWEWGTYDGRSRNRETGEEVASSGKLLRILKRSVDGSWKVHRSMWTVDPSTSGSGGS